MNTKSEKSHARNRIPLWRRSSSKKRGKMYKSLALDNIDRISMLPEDLLQKILLNLSLKDAVKTSALSKQWKNVWKHRLHLCVDMGFIMRTNPTARVNEVSRRFAESMTQTINNHLGRLDRCTILHFSCQCEDGTLERWIQTVTNVKHTKELTLVNCIGCLGSSGGYDTLPLDPSTFSHHSLKSLSLTRYKLTETNAFKSCCNLKILKIHDIIADINVLNKALTACSSLELLVLRMLSVKGLGVLEIKNMKLEILQLAVFTRMMMIKVDAPCLEILDITSMTCDSHNFILDAPNIRFNRNFWVCGSYPHISCNISFLTQEKKNIWFEHMVSQFYYMRRTGSLSVSIDIKNPKELKILKEILLFWGKEMLELEITFKNNNAAPKEGHESSAQQKWWDGYKPYRNAFFRVKTIWIYNINGSNDEEFAFVSRLVTKGAKLMIETSKYHPSKKLMIEAQVAKLMELSNKGNDHFTIECF